MGELHLARGGRGRRLSPPTPLHRSPTVPDRPTAPPRAWQRMLSGRRLDLLDPSPLDVEIEDVAHGLARVARWNGQTLGDHPFSVAQHSLLVEALAEAIAPGLTPRERLTALLHDAPEYVIGDMISPFKAVLGGTYKAVEARLADAVRVRFGLRATQGTRLGRIVKAADLSSAYLEATRLAGFSEEEATRFFGRPDRRVAADALARIESDFVEPWETGLAQRRFLERFRALEAADEARERAAEPLSGG